MWCLFTINSPREEHKPLVQATCVTQGAPTCTLALHTPATVCESHVPLYLKGLTGSFRHYKRVCDLIDNDPCPAVVVQQAELYVILHIESVKGLMFEIQMDVVFCSLERKAFTGGQTHPHWMCCKRFLPQCVNRTMPALPGYTKREVCGTLRTLAVR